MKVLLVYPQQKTLLGDESSVVGDPHLGLGYLSAMLRKNGVEVKIIDMRLGRTIDHILETIATFKPDLVGVTSYSLGYKGAYEIVERIKAHGQHLVVLGGPHVSVVRGDVLRETKADFAVKGEGEYTLLELCGKIEQKSDGFGDVLGLIWRRGEEVVENPNRPFIKDLGALPFPTYDEMENLKEYATFRADAGIQIATSRGCPYGCNFCSVRLVMGRNFRARSPENVMEELEYWYRKGFRAFKFVDDCFTLDGKRVEALCNSIILKGLKIRWNLFNGIRVDMVTRELLEKMRDAGCGYVAFGVESGNDETLREIGKHITVEQVRRALRLTSEVGIKSAAFFIIGHPHETYEQAMETIKLAEELPASYVNFFNLVPYPGTELFDWVKENGRFIYPPEVYLNSVSLKQEDPVFETREFPAEERRRAVRKGFALYRKTALKLRLGSTLGNFAYWVTSPRFMERLFWKLALGTKFGFFVVKHTNRFTMWNTRRAAARSAKSKHA